MTTRGVCQALSWPLIDKDDARDCLQGLPPALLQAFDANQLSYDIMFSYCRTQLQLGLSTALDCPFARAALYHRALELANQVQYSSTVLHTLPQRSSCSQLRARGCHTHQPHPPHWLTGAAAIPVEGRYAEPPAVTSHQAPQVWLTCVDPRAVC